MGYESRIKQVMEKSKELMPQLPYHNFEHAKRVYAAVQKLAWMEKVGKEDKIALETAALLHDIIFIPGAKDNAEKSGINPKWASLGGISTTQRLRKSCAIRARRKT